jgi:mRNA interferase HigB
MHLLSRSPLRDFWSQPGHHDPERPLRAWATEVRKNQWCGPADVKKLYANASFVGRDRVVFNIGGNKYRLIVAMKYAEPKTKRKGIVFVRFVGTHAQYDKVDATKV